jgi:alpha-L-fucosidase
MSYYTDAQFIGAFVDRISKGGSMILNTSPMPDGTYPQRQKDIMAAFGKFLKQMGTAIYNTRAWAVFGEGPTKMGGGEFTSPTALTTSDVRYTKSKDGDAVYAIFGGWPGNGKQVTLASVTTSRFTLGTGKVFLFGPTGNGSDAMTLQATQDSSGLHVTLPSTQPYTALAYAIKISASGTAPEATPWLSGAPNSDAGVPATGGSGGSPDATPAGSGGAGAGGRSGTGGAGDASVGSGGVRGTGGARTGGASAGGTGAGGAGTGGLSGSGGTSVPSSRGGASGSGGTSAAGGSAGNAGGAVASGGNGAAGTSVGVGGSGGSGATGGSVQGGSATGGATTHQTSSSSGCSCAMQGAGRRNAGGLVLLSFAVTLLMRRRRR